MAAGVKVLGYKECKELYGCLRSCVAELAKYCKSCDHEACDSCPINTVKTKITLTAKFIKEKLYELERQLNVLLQELDDSFWAELKEIEQDIEKMLAKEGGKL